MGVKIQEFHDQRAIEEQLVGCRWLTPERRINEMISMVESILRSCVDL